MGSLDAIFLAIIVLILLFVVLVFVPPGLVLLWDSIRFYRNSRPRWQGGVYHSRNISKRRPSKRRLKKQAKKALAEELHFVKIREIFDDPKCSR